MFDSSIIYGHFYFAIAAVLDNNNGDIAADMKECILNVQPLCDCRNEFLQRTYIFYQPFDMFVLHAFATTKGLFYVSRWPWIICVCVFCCCCCLVYTHNVCVSLYQAVYEWAMLFQRHFLSCCRAANNEKPNLAQVIIIMNIRGNLVAMLAGQSIAVAVFEIRPTTDSLLWIWNIVMALVCVRRVQLESFAGPK